MAGWQLGDIAVSAIVDEECIEMALSRIFPESSPHRLAGEDWLEPDHLDAARGMVKLGLHSFLLRTPSLNILVDTCIGQHKHRPNHPAWHDRRSTRLLDDLAQMGLMPSDIDLVFCTHLHADHVGWNTRLIDGRWVPTFPKARYAMSARELREWQAAQAESAEPVNHGAYQDSVLPVVVSGQALPVAPGDDFLPGIRIVSLAGHTSDHFGLLVTRGEEGPALFCGDAMHSAVQLVEPRWSSAFCVDPAQATATRLDMLDRAARENILLFPAHFRGPRAVRVRAAGSGYRIV